MKNRKWIKVFVSILCVLTLLISNISPLSWGGKSIDEAQAADWDGLTELTWSDFGIPCNGASNANGQLVSGKEMNNSLFNGDVTMQADSEIRYAGVQSYEGLVIGVNASGNLTLETANVYSTYFGGKTEFTAETFGLKSFIDTKFNLKIAITGYTTTTTPPQATVRVWVNDQMVGESFEFQYHDWCGCKMLGTYMTLHQGTIEPDYALHELTWSDFGIPCNGASNANGQLVSGKEMNNSLFNGDVTMQADSEIRYAGVQSYEGLVIGVNASGNLTLETANVYSTYFGGKTEFTAETFGLKSFIDTKFNLKIAITGYTTTTTPPQATVRVWVNDQMVGESFEFQYHDWCGCKTLGTYMTLHQGTIEPNYALHELTWSDFGISCDEQQTGVSGQLVSSKEMNNSLFNGYVTMQADSEIRYAGVQSYEGLVIGVNASGNLTLETANVYSTYFGGKTEFTAETFGLKSFIDTKFNLKIAITGYTTTTTPPQATVRVWVNDQMVGEPFELQYHDWCGCKTLGTYMTLHQGTIEPGTSEPDDTFYELTWSDFGIPCNGASNTNGQLVSGKEMNNSLFNGDVTMQADSEIRYAGVQSYEGLVIGVNASGNLTLSTANVYSIYFSEPAEFTAETFGLKSFIDTKFNLKIEITGYDTTVATVKVWVNDQMVGESFELQYLDWCGCKTLGTYLSLHKGTIEPDYALHELTWSDFGIPCNGQQTGVSGQLVSGKEMNNSLFNGDIIMQADSEIRYAGVQSYEGLVIGVNASGNLTLETANVYSIYHGGKTEFTAETFGLKSFIDTKFNLKIAIAGYTTTTTPPQATVRVWVNDQMVGEPFELQYHDWCGCKTLGTYMSLQTGTIDPAYTNGTSVPTGLTDLTWEDFGFTCIGQYATTTSGSLTSSKEMNNSLFSGDITMQAGSHIRYAGSADWIGLMIGVNAGGNLTLSTAVLGAEYLVSEKVFSAATFGLSSFADTKFNLKIAITEFSTASAKVGVWVNDQMVGDYFTIVCTNDSYPLGNYMALFQGTLEPHSSIAKPTELTEIHFGDWNSGIYADGVLNNNELSGDVSHPDVDTLLNTSLKENVKFTGPGASMDGQYVFCWGGLKTEGKTWYGLRIDFVGDTMKLYKVNNDATSSSSNHFTLTADTLGIDNFSFYDREYLWQVDITQCGDNVLVWMYFDGILYGNAPIVIQNLASEMSDTLVFSPMPKVDGTPVERPAALGVTERTLSDLYHDLDVNAYVIPSRVVKMQKKNIVDGVATWEDMVVNGGDKITVAGDYKVKFNDGVSDYTQEVVIYRSGDTKINDQNTVGAADLVRLIKATKAGVDAAYKCEEWAYDVNSDYVIDAETDSMKNVEVVTLREIILGTYIEDTSEKMEIVGFAGPTGNMIKDEVYQKIQKLGITLIIENGGDHPYSDVPSNRYYTYEQLTLAQKYGLKMTVPDQRLIDMRTESVATIQTYLPEAIENYKDYQSFAGLFIVDEPVTTSYPPYYLSYTNPNAAKFSEYANLAKIVNNMEVNGQKLIAYSNALGYCYQHVNNVTSPYKYMDYLNGFAEEYGNTFVSATYYPFLGEHVDIPDEGSAVNGSDYFKHLALNRYVANESGNPLWTFVQAGDCFEMTRDDDPLTEGEFKWSANMGLAFGAKGIQYFSLMQPINSIYHQSDMGLLDYTGAENKAGYYDWAIDVNKELTAIDDILMNATHEGIMTTSGYATSQAAENVNYDEEELVLYASKNWLGNGADPQGNAGVYVYNDSGYNGATVTCATDSKYGTLTGCFETSDGKHALFIVNYNPESENTVAVNVGENVAATVIHEGNTTEATGSTYITIRAGEAALVVF